MCVDKPTTLETLERANGVSELGINAAFALSLRLFFRLEHSLVLNLTLFY